MAIMEINIIPLGTKTPSVSKYLAEPLKLLKKEGVKFELTSMSTIIEGDIDTLFELARKMHFSAFTLGVERIVTTIKIDDRRDKPSTIEGKIEKLREKI
ncbi:MTH1187 family thiamine-binding protein [Candidatus Aerophobetes bacterium]|nr:MTH1187 family thiamine-binding protein [Candidatus Aerophobetes bacterium]